MKVFKYGSSTLASASKIKEVARQVAAEKGKGNIIVLSSINGSREVLTEVADYLYKKNVDGAKELMNNLDLQYMNLVDALFPDAKSNAEMKKKVEEVSSIIRETAKELFTKYEEKIIIAQGELLISDLFVAYLETLGVHAKHLNSLDFMKTDKNDEPDVNFIKGALETLLEENKTAEILVTEGFICRNAYGEIDNLGKGGSDYSATLIGVAAHAEEVVIWSDTYGIYNTDPSIVVNACPVKSLTFDETAELSYFLDKAIHPMCILPAKLANLPIRLMNVLSPEAEGTLVSSEMPNGKVKAIAAKDGITMIKIKSVKMLLAHGFLRRVFEVFEGHKTAIDMITTSEIGVSVTIDNDKYLEEILNDLKTFGTVSVSRNMTIICVVGDMRSGEGAANCVLDAIKELPTHMVSYGGSLQNISLLVESKDKKLTLNQLNKKLF